MKVVLDTNVLVSGLISAHGPCGQVLGLLFEGVIQPCVDERILDEYEAVLARPVFGIRRDDVSDALELIRSRAEVLTPVPLPLEMPDPSDVAFVEVASEVGAALITGNTRHYPKKACKGVAVVSPRQFLDILRRPL